MVKKLKTSMLKPSLCNYSDACIFVKGTTKITGAESDVAAGTADRTCKNISCKNGAPFTNCRKENNSRQTDNAKDLDVVMLLYDLSEYRDNYTKTLCTLYQCPKDKPNTAKS